MSEYIIKNCPARVLFTDGYFCRQADGNILCKERTDCLLKQIVDKCNKIIFLNSNIDFKEGFSNLAVGENFVARQVLQLLDIQEAECEKKN